LYQEKFGSPAINVVAFCLSDLLTGPWVPNICNRKSNRVVYFSRDISSKQFSTQVSFAVTFFPKIFFLNYRVKLCQFSPDWNFDKKVYLKIH
jgi:hypothetical protein